MAFVLINRAEDGTHTSAHKTEAAALAKLVEMMGRDTHFGLPLRVGQTYVDDWGRRFTIEERAAGHTARTEDALREAYDARECGVATKRQLALLAKHNF